MRRHGIPRDVVKSYGSFFDPRTLYVKVWIFFKNGYAWEWAMDAGRGDNIDALFSVIDSVMRSAVDVMYFPTVGIVIGGDAELARLERKAS